MPGGGSIARTLTLTVPDYAPAGTYTMTGYVGGYPSYVWDSDSFTFEKLSDGDAGGLVTANSFTLSGWEELATPIESIPSEFAVAQAFPNPFNPTTTISFQLPEAAKVTLSVYDIHGRLVAEPVNGWRDAGTHQAVFDGCGLASGVYVYTLKAGEFNATGKMVLMK